MRRVLERCVGLGVGLFALAAGCGQSTSSVMPHAQAGSGGSAVTAMAGSAGQPTTPPPPSSLLDQCAGTVAPRSPITRWSVIDLDRTLDQWFGPGITLDGSAAFDDQPFARELSRGFVRALASGAAARVRAVVPDDLTPEICDAGSVMEPNCLQTWIAEWGGKLYRRPLRPEQIEAYVAQFRSQPQAATPADAARNVLVSMILSPYFVLRLELGDSSVPSRLDPYEAATRLSHFAARRAPDAALTARAAADELREPAQLLAELRRLWSDPEAQRGRVLTHLEWLGISSGHWRVDLSPELQTDMATQASLLINDVLASPTPTLQALLTWNRQYVNSALADHYKVARPFGDDFEPLIVNNSLAAGVLATGAFLSTFPRPTLRGRQISEALLDQLVPPPPLVDLTLGAGTTPRERITSVTSQNAVCQACHSIMDPVGFALEAFDDQGRVTGFDTTGALPNYVDGPTQLANPHELGAAIALSNAGRSAAARHYLEFALDRAMPVTTSALAAIGTPALPTPMDPDQRWFQCVASVATPMGLDFDFTLVAEALASSSLMTTRADPSQRVVAFDTSYDPVEHALHETSQFRGVFSNAADERVVQGYERALQDELSYRQLQGTQTGAGGQPANADGGAAGAGGAP